MELLILHVFLVLAGLERNYAQPSSSMQPTIMIGDAFSMRTYRLYTIGPPVRKRAAEQGDIVVFCPGDVEPGSTYVKRVVAVGGDRVQMQAGRLFINGELVERTPIGRFEDADSFGTVVQVTRYEETLPNGVSHLINEISDDMPLDDTAEMVVPVGEYFMLGDNRDRSLDSRIPEHGTVAPGALVAIRPSTERMFFWTGAH